MTTGHLVSYITISMLQFILNNCFKVFLSYKKVLYKYKVETQKIILLETLQK